jgi:hypothetical protein
VVGDITGMRLDFGADSISSDFRLKDILGWLEAWIDLDDIRVEWKKEIWNLCTLKPAPVTLADVDGSDHQNWLTCHELEFAAGEGTLADPILFDVIESGEAFSTPFSPGQNVTVALDDITAETGTGICGQEWMAPTIHDAILAWELEVQGAIETDLLVSPGQDETLDRLLSPYELGRTQVTTPPIDTPPYEIHPLSTYALSATIGEATDDMLAFETTSSHGLYVPYLTRTSSYERAAATWFCPHGGGQLCDGESGRQPARLENGFDPGGVDFDVALSLRTAFLNQLLWAQAQRDEFLGAPAAPVDLGLAPDLLLRRARDRGLAKVAKVLEVNPHGFGLRSYHASAPYTVVNDSLTTTQKLLYVTTDIVVELYAIKPDGSRVVLAKVLYDVLDEDHRLSLRAGGIVDRITSSWSPATYVIEQTTQFLPGCYDIYGKASCDDELRTLIGGEWLDGTRATLIEMMENVPALQRFDAGQESSLPRHLKNARTYLRDQEVVLVADLCKPGTTLCE